MDRILIIEDNTDVSRMLAEALEEAGFSTTAEYTGLGGLDAAKSGEYSLILLDIMLPYKSGDEILRELRLVSDVPVIVISAKDIIGTKIDLLRLGADDYITKPFDLGEVVARVEAQLRRARKQQPGYAVFHYKDLTLDENKKEVLLGSVPLELTAKEYQILAMLMANPDKVFTKENLFESVWQEDYIHDDNAVKTHISNLRGKLKKINPNEDYIETVWGLGYRMCKG